MSAGERFDYAIVGAGFGGLAAGALLARRGLKVVVLEAMGIPGGCAQTFRRGQYRYDAGATTIVGIEPHLPLGRLAREIDVDLDLDPVDPAMAVWLDDRRIDRHADREAWIEEACRHFGANQRALWEDVFRTSDLAWRVATSTPRFPPASLGDWVRTAGDAFPTGLRMLPALSTSTARRIRRHLGEPTAAFERFVDEQLLITAQAFADRVPFAVGAMGLSYTNLGNYTAPGGVGALAETLVRAIREAGGEVRYGRRVERLSAAGDGYRLETRRGEIEARGVVSNLTVWDMAEVCDGDVGDYFRGEAGETGDDAWGAFMVYLGVEDTFGDEPALHHQVIFDEPLPVTGSRSVFVSISPRGDLQRAPEGHRAVTVSTHTEVEPWWAVEKERYHETKEMVADAILDRIARASGLGRLAVAARLTGTPRTFVRYTHRSKGRVGGLPSTFSTLVNARPPVTPFPSLFLVGDTVFPGQGIPAVVLGALNVADRIASLRHQDRAR